eukprot:9742715-Alexandrium_andersonii.AAC.1
MVCAAGPQHFGGVRGPPPLAEAVGTPGPSDIETARAGNPPVSARRESTNHLGIVASGGATAPTRRFPDSTDTLAPQGGARSGHYLHTATHVSPPAPGSIMDEPAAPPPPLSADPYPLPAGAPAPAVPAPPASSRSASEVVQPEAVPHIGAEPAVVATAAAAPAPAPFSATA